MDVAQYIEELLNENEEVSIPGVGTLFQKTVSATFDSDGNTFYPPKKTLNFIAGKGDSTLLAEYIAKARNLTLPSAKYFAEQFGATIQSDIKTYGTADISPLGTLSINADQYIFTPLDTYNTKEYFGLPPVKDITDIDETVPATSVIEQEHVQKEALEYSTPVPTIIQQPIEEAQQEEETLSEYEAKPRRVWPIILVVLTALVALGIVGILSYPNFFNHLKKQYFAPAPQPKKATAIKKPQTIADSLVTADSILSALQQQGFEVEKVPDTIANITTQTETITPQKTISYEIIGASLGSAKEAEKYIAQLKTKGIDARILDKRRGRLILISLGSFTDKTKAEAEQKRIQAEVTADAWILEIKK